jgi:Flp pilus assembly protein TadD
MVSRPAILFTLVLVLSVVSAAQIPGPPWAGQGLSTNTVADGRSPNRATLIGSVRTFDNHPVANARVEVRDISSASGATSTYTSTSGDFEIDDLPAGTYEVIAYMGISEVHQQLIVQSARNFVTLRMGSNTNSEAGGSNTVSVQQFQVPGKARDAFRKAQAYADQLKLDEARKYIAKALSIYPQYAEAMALRGILKLDVNQPQDAAADLEQAVHFDSGYPVAYIALGAAYNMLSRFDDALRAIDRGLALSPMSWQAYFEMGKAYVGKGDFANAVKQLDKAQDLAPPKFALVHLVKAHALLGVKDYTDAMSELQAYLNRDPSGPKSEQARQTLERLRAFAAVETR